jgi:hypothetical protein
MPQGVWPSSFLFSGLRAPLCGTVHDMDGHRGPATRHRLGLLAGCAAGTVALAGVLGGCGTQHPTIAELKAVPGATSSYPGSVAIYGHGERKGEHTLVNASGAMLFTTYCTDASAAEVTDWFSSKLGRAGWTADPNPVGMADTDVLATEAWYRGERLFDVELLSPAYVGRVSATLGLPCRTGYKTIVQ